MNKVNQKNVMEQLLDQELPLTNEQYLAYRQKVTDGIRKVRREEKIMRIVTKSAWALTAVVFLIVGILDFNLERVPGSPQDLFRLSLIFPTLVCLACSTALLAFYLINYRPRLRNAEHEAMLLGLQRQLHELGNQSQDSTNRPPAGQGKSDQTAELSLAYRRRVSDGILKVQKQERIVRIVTKSAWAVTGIVLLSGAIVDFNREAFSDLVRDWVIVANIVCINAAVALLVIYLINYRPRLRNTEQEAMLLGLQRQLHELRHQLQQSPNRPPPAHGNDALPKG